MESRLLKKAKKDVELFYDKANHSYVLTIEDKIFRYKEHDLAMTDYRKGVLEVAKKMTAGTLKKLR